MYAKRCRFWIIKITNIKQSKKGFVVEIKIVVIFRLVIIKKIQVRNDERLKKIVCGLKECFICIWRNKQLHYEFALFADLRRILFRKAKMSECDMIKEIIKCVSY